GGAAAGHRNGAQLAAGAATRIALALSIAALLTLLTLGVSLWMRGAVPRLGRLRHWRPRPAGARSAALALVIAMALLVPGGGATVERGGPTPADQQPHDAPAAGGGPSPD